MLATRGCLVCTANYYTVHSRHLVVANDDGGCGGDGDLDFDDYGHDNDDDDDNADQEG